MSAATEAYFVTRTMRPLKALVEGGDQLPRSPS